MGRSATPAAIRRSQRCQQPSRPVRRPPPSPGTPDRPPAGPTSPHKWEVPPGGQCRPRGLAVAVCRATWAAWPLTSSTTTPWSPPSSSTPTRCAMTTATRWSIRRRSGSMPASTNRSTSGWPRRRRTCRPPTSTRAMPTTPRPEVVSTSNDELDRLDPQQHGRERGQIDGTPEDGESFFDVVE